ncbi:uncharacterized protein L201_007525 [Kwoniella dendrophila CBS 6074]|uniref:NADH:flavin oxidoreductase/NADH oxidase N-terminal domain-containing protein n=1 Tax=Kwoniella dendrophila CBS 6074 TaxID=1295534 RepID=A0AAX4K4B5_9TREE
MTLIKEQPRNDTGNLFKPIHLGDMALKHKIVMAPMTRLRAGKEDGIPNDWSIEYYSSRATDGGLIIAEGISPSSNSRVWQHQPGLWSEEQVVQWKKVTEAIHAKGGKVTAQLVQAGRVATPGINEIIYSPSDNHDPTPGAPKPPLTVMNQDDIDEAIKEIVIGSQNAIKAGFDGIELHAANGYLVDQFIQSNSNRRTDKYGGSIENRIRLMLEITRSVLAVIPAQKIGLRISPFSRFQGMREPNVYDKEGELIDGPIITFSNLLEKIFEEFPQLAYVHVVESRITGSTDQDSDKFDVVKDTIQPFREISKKYKTPFIASGGFTKESAIEHSKKYQDDLIAFGRYFTSNPDLVERIRNNLPIVKYDRSTFYSQGKEGYLGWETYAKPAELAK